MYFFKIFFFLCNFIIHFVKLQVKLLMNTLWKKIKHSSFTTEHVLVCERLLLFLTMQVFVLFPSVWESSKPAEGWRTLVLSIRPVVLLGAAEFCPANQQQETDIKKASLQKYLTFRFPSLSVFFSRRILLRMLVNKGAQISPYSEQKSETLAELK